MANTPSQPDPFEPESAETERAEPERAETEAPQAEPSPAEALESLANELDALEQPDGETNGQEPAAQALPGQEPSSQEPSSQEPSSQETSSQSAAAQAAAPPAEEAEPLIVFSHVSIAFGDQVVLQDVSFSVHRGKTLCILGRSGVGKSVTLRLLMGFLKPDSGSIRVEGREITDLNEEGLRTLRKRVTMVFQNGALFDSLSVRENVAFPLRERGGLADDQVDQLVDRLIALVGAEDVVGALPASLSTGRKRAVAIARALASQPEAVLYDEPTTMVDPLIAKRLGNLIQRLKQQLGFTSVVVTHDMRFAERLADTVLFLDQGLGRYFGPLEGFLASSDPDIRQFLTLDAYVLPSV